MNRKLFPKVYAALIFFVSFFIKKKRFEYFKKGLIEILNITSA
jgi:hypothetical protein